MHGAHILQHAFSRSCRVRSQPNRPKSYLVRVSIDALDVRQRIGGENSRLGNSNRQSLGQVSAGASRIYDIVTWAWTLVSRTACRVKTELHQCTAAHLDSWLSGSTSPCAQLADLLTQEISKSSFSVSYFLLLDSSSVTISFLEQLMDSSGLYKYTGTQVAQAPG